MKMLICVTKEKPWLYEEYLEIDPVSSKVIGRKFGLTDTTVFGNELNGKVVLECDFEIEEIIEDTTSFASNYKTNILSGEALKIRSCMTNYDLIDYLGDKTGYAVHIKNVKIYENSKELNEFYNSKHVKITKTPKNMCYAKLIEPFKQEIVMKGKLQELRGTRVREYAMISVHPKDACDILNGKKTTIVCKKVLKEVI